MAQAISTISRASVKIVARRIFGDGTEHNSNCVLSGFFWRSEGQPFLITNWHNVTGLNQITLSEQGTFFPSHFDISFIFIQNSNRPGHDLLVRRAQRLSLYGNNGQPNWREHCRRHEIDLVAIAVGGSMSEGGRVVCLNDVDFETRWSPDVGADCFLVGYPEGLEGQFSTPIWKRASIASEPRLNQDGLPLVLVDTVGNPGLSGSPVIATASGIFSPGEALSGDAGIGTWSNLLGVYSGRLGDAGVGFQLGRVWKASLLPELFGNGVAGCHPKLN